MSIPFFWPLNSRRKCSNCGHIERPLLDIPFLVCYTCRGASYCSQECMVYDWDAHAPGCKDTSVEPLVPKPKDCHRHPIIGLWVLLKTFERYKEISNQGNRNGDVPAYDTQSETQPCIQTELRGVDGRYGPTPPPSPPPLPIIPPAAALQ